ncbi:MAG: hypothetical protein QGH25_24610, partial [Candidatus Latescibacteria bacterium]|nr:hypothetical protein [Candidatus Latescibacterota bacterium]
MGGEVEFDKNALGVMLGPAVQRFHQVAGIVLTVWFYHFRVRLIMSETGALLALRPFAVALAVLQPAGGVVIS